jgi:hypothetical protein
MRSEEEIQIEEEVSLEDPVELKLTTKTYKVQKPRNEVRKEV